MADDPKPVQTPPATVVQGTPAEQFGLPHLRFVCPKCGLPQALSGPGRHLCPNCNAHLEVRGG